MYNVEPAAIQERYEEEEQQVRQAADNVARTVGEKLHLGDTTGSAFEILEQLPEGLIGSELGEYLINKGEDALSNMSTEDLQAMLGNLTSRLYNI